MTARGVNFLENWIAKNVTAGEIPDDPLHAFRPGKRAA